MNRILWISLSCLFLMPTARAASFDCRNAVSKMEKLICADSQLSKSDEELAAAYSRTLKESLDPAAIRKQQREWLSDVRKRCENVACLRDAYATRMAQLGARSDAPQQSASARRAADDCKVQEIAAHTYANTVLVVQKEVCGQPSNSGDNYAIRGILVEKSQYGEKTLLALSDWEARFFDVDNDSIPEIDFMEVNTTANANHLIYKYSPADRSLRKILEFFGTSIHEFGGYLVSDINDAAFARSAEAFKILDERLLTVDSSPSFVISSNVLFGDDTETCTCQFAVKGTKARVAIDPPSARWTKFCFFYDKDQGPAQCTLTGRDGRTSNISNSFE
jgi:uncharacterized protein